MSVDPRVSDLLLLWEELREQGHDCPARLGMEKQLVQRSEGLIGQLKETFGRLERVPREGPDRRGRGRCRA